MATRVNTLEGGTVGSEITAANSGGASGDAFESFTSTPAGGTRHYSNDVTILGAKVAKLATSTTSGIVDLRWNVTTGLAYTRCYYYFTANPGANLRIMRGLDGAAVRYSVLLLTNGKLRILNTSDGTVAETSGTVPLNAPFRLEIRADLANGNIELRLFAGANLHSTTSTESIGPFAITYGGTQITQICQGSVVGLSNLTAFYVDGLGISTTGWMGPGPNVIRVTKIFSWLNDAEGFADLGMSGSVVAARSSSGDPPGCVAFTTQSVVTNDQEIFARNVSGQTWETWGAPAGTTVTHVRLVAWKHKNATVTGLSGHKFRMQIIGPGAASVTSDTGSNNIIDITTLGTGINGSFLEGTPSNTIEVNAEDQASDTDVRLYLWLYDLTTTGTPNYNFQVDEVQLELTCVPLTQPLDLYLVGWEQGDWRGVYDDVYYQPAGATVTKNDALGLTDSIAAVQSSLQTVSDAVGLTDSVAGALTTSSGDNLGLTDSITVYITKNFAPDGTNTQTWVVPAGVTSVDVTLDGAQGGDGGAAGVGGLGGRLVTTIAVTPAETLHLRVATAGGDNSGATGGTSGFVGGAAGGDAVVAGIGGGGGAGSSDIRQGGTAESNRIAVAGGGGGGANNGPDGAVGGGTLDTQATGSSNATAGASNGIVNGGGGGGGGWRGGAGGGLQAAGGGGTNFHNTTVCSNTTSTPGAVTGSGSIAITYIPTDAVGEAQTINDPLGLTDSTSAVQTSIQSPADSLGLTDATTGMLDKSLRFENQIAVLVTT